MTAILSATLAGGSGLAEIKGGKSAEYVDDYHPFARLSELIYLLEKAADDLGSRNSTSFSGLVLLVI